MWLKMAVAPAIFTPCIPKKLDFDGGDPDMILSILSDMFNILEVKWKNDVLGMKFVLFDDATNLGAREANTPCISVNKDSPCTEEGLRQHIKNIILERIQASDGEIICIPLYGTIRRTRALYSILYGPPGYNLEGIIRGTASHVLALTHCGRGWLKYDNIGNKTTEILPFGTTTNTKIFDFLVGGSTTNILVYCKRN